MKKIKSSILNLKNTKSLCITAMLLALRVILGSMFTIITPQAKIGFSFLPVFIASYLFGPISGALVGGLGDIVSYIINPTGGAYFPGFTINGILLGLLYGFFFYKESLSLKKVVFCELIYIIFIELLLSSLWLMILLDKGYFVLLASRIIKVCITCPIEIILIIIFGKTANALKKHI